MRVVTAVASGALLYVSFAPAALWWCAPLGMAGMFWVLTGQSLRAGLLYGLLTGLAMMLPLLWWTGEFVGPVGSVPLGFLQASMVAVTTAAIAMVSELRGAPLWAALIWVAGESVRSLVPFGGFPWASLAFGQVDAPWVSLAAVGSTSMVTLAVALAGFSLATLIRELFGAGRGLARRVGLGLAVVGATAPVGAGLAAGALTDTAAEDGMVTVAAVQGNVPRAGLDFNAERRAVLDNHVQETLRLASDIQTGRVRRPHLVVWPENSSDIDPFTNEDAYAQIQRAVEAVDVPILVGAVVGGGGPAPRNTVLLWDPELGPGETYAKRRLQPFGETMPMRAFFRVFSDQVDRAGRFVPGTEARVLDVHAARVGIAMCYEVIFDDVVRDSVRNGANLIVVPSNNATFGYTDMTYQQLAIDRFRAVEHGRSVVVAATSGVSAIIEPDGRVVQRTGMFEPATLVRSVPLRSSLTLADRVGSAPEWSMNFAGLAALAFVTIRRRRGTRRRPSSSSLPVGSRATTDKTSS